MRNLGCFVSCAGGIYKALENAKKLSVNVCMIHPSPPQRWNTIAHKEAEIAIFNQQREKYPELKKIYFHGIYLINLANPDSQKFHLSKISLLNHLILLKKTDCDGLIFHTGSFKEISEEDGFKRVVFGLNWIFEHFDKEVGMQKTFWDSPKLFLEMSAGSGKIIGDKAIELKKIYDEVKPEYKNRIGFCLDTQHMFASGYDLTNDLEGVVLEIDTVLGLENIPVIHFNDSKTQLASNKDRHENIGQGLIGEKTLRNFLNHNKLKDKDFILETPALKELESAKKEVEKLQKWAK